MPKKSKEFKVQPRFYLITKWMPILTCIVMSLLVASFVIRWWPLEFLVSFTPQLLIFMSAAILIYGTFATHNLLVLGRRRFVEEFGTISVASFVVTAVLLIGSGAFSTTVARVVPLVNPIAGSNSLSVGTFNKLYKSSEFTSDSSFLTARKVDIITVQEVDKTELDGLARSLNHEYSYITNCNCSASDTEVGIISRYPITNALEIYKNENSVIVRSVIQVPNQGELILYAVHMHIPYERESYRLRGEAYQALTAAINSDVSPVVVAGDFNTTIFSPDMSRFSSETTGITNVITREWPRCSWYSSIGLDLGALCARIDYVFVPEGSAVHSQTVAQAGSSDHRPIIVSFTLPQSSPRVTPQ